MLVGITIALMVFFTAETLHAQTVSIVTESNTSESLMVEAAMKQLLRDEGYAVKSDTTEGIILQLSVMRVRSKSGEVYGLSGHISVVTLQWQNFADLVVSDSCKEDHAAAQTIKDYLGTRMIYIDSTMAIASTEDGLASMLTTYANHTIRKTATKMKKFINEIKSTREQTEQSDVINPMR